MTFSKSFPRTIGNSNYPVWEEISLTDEEEREIEKKATAENHLLMEKCITNAETMFAKKRLKPYLSNVVMVATALFEKRASHEVFHKERKCKEKFDKIFGGMDG